MAHAERFVKGENFKPQESQKKFWRQTTFAGLLLASAWVMPPEVDSEPKKVDHSFSPSSFSLQETKVLLPAEKDLNTQEGILSTLIPRYKRMSPKQRRQLENRVVQDTENKNLLYYYPEISQKQIPPDTTWLKEQSHRKHFIVVYGDKTFTWIIGQNDNGFYASCFYKQDNQPKPILVLRDTNTGYGDGFYLTEPNSKASRACLNSNPHMKQQIVWDDVYGLILLGNPVGRTLGEGMIVGQYDWNDQNIRDIDTDRKENPKDAIDVWISPDGVKVKKTVKEKYFDYHLTSLYLRPRMLKKPLFLPQLFNSSSRPPPGLIPLSSLTP